MTCCVSRRVRSQPQHRADQQPQVQRHHQHHNHPASLFNPAGIHQIAHQLVVTGKNQQWHQRQRREIGVILDGSASAYCANSYQLNSKPSEGIGTRYGTMRHPGARRNQKTIAVTSTASTCPTSRNCSPYRRYTRSRTNTSNRSGSMCPLSRILHMMASACDKVMPLL